MLIITIVTCLAFGASIAVGCWLHFRGFEHDESNVVLCSQVGRDGSPSLVARGDTLPVRTDASGASRFKRPLTHHALAQPAHELFSGSAKSNKPAVGYPQRDSLGQSKVAQFQ